MLPHRYHNRPVDPRPATHRLAVQCPESLLSVPPANSSLIYSRTHSNPHGFDTHMLRSGNHYPCAVAYTHDHIGNTSDSCTEDLSLQCLCLLHGPCKIKIPGTDQMAMNVTVLGTPSDVPDSSDECPIGLQWLWCHNHLPLPDEQFVWSRNGSHPGETGAPSPIRLLDALSRKECLCSEDVILDPVASLPGHGLNVSYRNGRPKRRRDY